MLVREGAHLEVELASEVFADAIDLARAFAGKEDVVDDVVVGVLAAEVAALRHKVLHRHDRVLDGLMNNRSFPGLVVRRDRSADPRVFVSVLDDDGLNDVVHVVNDRLLNALAEIDDGAFLGRMLDRVTVSVEAEEGLVIIVGRDVSLFNHSLGHFSLLDDLREMLLIANRLDVMLNMGDVSLVRLDPLDFLDLVMEAGLLDLLGEVEMRVRSLLWVESVGERMRTIVAK